MSTSLYHAKEVWQKLVDIQFAPYRTDGETDVLYDKLLSMGRSQFNVCSWYRFNEESEIIYEVNARAPLRTKLLSHFLSTHADRYMGPVYPIRSEGVMRRDEDLAWLPLEMPGIFSLSAKGNWLRNKMLSMGLSGFAVDGRYRFNSESESVYEVAAGAPR